MDVLEAPASQAQGYDYATGAVHGAVDNVEVFLAHDNFLVNHGFLNGSHIVVIHFSADDFNQFVVGLELYVLNLNLVHLVNDTLVMGSQYLCTVCPVSLVTVVFLGVVACCYVHTGNGTELADGKADFGSGAKAFKEIYLDAVGAENGRYGFCKEAAVVAAVVTHNHTALLSGESLQNVVGEALCGHAHNVFVHSVGSSTHNAAKTAGSELKVLIERVNQIRLVLLVKQGLYLCFSLCIKYRTVNPLLCLCYTGICQFNVHRFIMIKYYLMFFSAKISFF